MSFNIKVTRQKRSPVWAYFDDLGPKAKCTLCRREYARQTGTTNLFNHLKAVHEDEYAKVAGSEPTIVKDERTGDVRTSAGTKPLGSFFHSARPCSAQRADTITQLLLDWVIGSTRPLTIVEDVGLSLLLKFIEPGYTLPSRTHFTRLLEKRHAKGREELKALLSSDATGGVSLTTDGWTSSSTQSYVTHTAHFLTAEWDVVSAVLETGRFSGSHTGQALSKYTAEVVEQFQVHAHQISCITHDEAANQVAAARMLTEKFGWPSNVCMAHMMQTAIRHALDSCHVIRRLLACARKLVGHFKHSSLATEALDKKQVQLQSGCDERKPPVHVVQDVSTRWNSTYYMVRRLLLLRIPLTAVLCDPQLTRKADDRLLMLSDNQWNLAEELKNILAEYEMATTIVSGQRYVTLSLLLPVISHLNEVTSSAATTSTVAAARRFAAKLSAELMSKFPIQNLDLKSVQVLSAVVDPRFHDLKFLEGKQCDRIRQVLKDMLNDQRKKEDDEGEKKAESGSVVEAATPPKLKKESSLSRLLMQKSSAVTVSQPSKAAADQEFQGKLDREVQLYFAEDSIGLDEDPLLWWKKNSPRFPNIAKVARRYLAINATSVPSERVFSAAGLLVSKLRNSLSPSRIDAAIFLGKNTMLKSARSRLATADQSMGSCYRQGSAHAAPVQEVIAEEEEELVIQAVDPPFPDFQTGED